MEEQVHKVWNRWSDRIEVENHTIFNHAKVTNEIEQEILDLRITKRFGCNRIRFRLKRSKGDITQVLKPYTRY